MMASCEECIISSRGYTVDFAGIQKIDSLHNYYIGLEIQQWERVSESIFWLEESIFFNLIDYVNAHLDTNPIMAVLSSRSDPLSKLDHMKPIGQFQQEREASWIDTIILNKRIRTHYQPIVSLHDEEVRIVGHELLSRGINEDGSLIPPNKMFEAARSRNRLFALDRLCRMESVSNSVALQDQLIFINFIPTAIYVPEHCLSTTFALIRELNLKPENIVFEVIESDEVKDTEHLKSILRYYKSHGFKYALDDVGVGYNNLKMLSQMDPDYIKLAFEFSNGVSRDDEKRKIAQEVIDIAHELKATPLAEGVERKEDLDCLREMGYELFQGYYFAKPQELPLQQIDSL